MNRDRQVDLERWLSRSWAALGHKTVCGRVRLMLLG